MPRRSSDERTRQEGRPPDFYQESGRVGGEACLKKRGKEFYAELGRRSAASRKLKKEKTK